MDYCRIFVTLLYYIVIHKAYQYGNRYNFLESITVIWKYDCVNEKDSSFRLIAIMQVFYQTTQTFFI